MRTRLFASMLLLLLAFAGAAAPALAHESPAVEIVAPPSGGIVTGDLLHIVLKAGPGTGNVSVEVKLDGERVSRDGKVGQEALFATITLEAGKEVLIPVQGVEKGEHEVRVSYVQHPDNPRPDVVTKFTSRDQVKVDGGLRRTGSSTNYTQLVIVFGGLVGLGAIVFFVEKFRGANS